jgi:hypothetical protein
MELLFVTVLGAGFGTIFRYALPQRGTYGIFLLPALGAAIAAIVWVALLWIGLTFDGTWIWVASLGAAAAATLVTAIVLPGRRIQEDAQLFETLSRGKS